MDAVRMAQLVQRSDLQRSLPGSVLGLRSK